MQVEHSERQRKEGKQNNNNSCEFFQFKEDEKEKDILKGQRRKG
jgi:hypothetical protein